MMMADVDPTQGPVSDLWREVEGALAAMALDEAEPGQVNATIAEATARCVAALDAAGLDLSLDARARLARARRAVRDAASHRSDPGSRELRHDVGSALTAVVASLDVAAASLEEDTAEGRRETATAVAYAREAASRAVEGFRRLVSP